MTRKTFYLWLLFVFVVALVGIVLFPEPTLVVLVVLIPVAILAAIVSTLYCLRVFWAQPLPRSRFFSMVLELFGALLALGVWVGYLSVGRVLERTVANGDPVPFLLPVPSTTVSAPLSALLVVLVFMGPVRFGLEIYATRRRAGWSTNGETLELDPREEA